MLPQAAPGARSKIWQTWLVYVQASSPSLWHRPAGRPSQILGKISAFVECRKLRRSRKCGRRIVEGGEDSNIWGEISRAGPEQRTANTRVYDFQSSERNILERRLNQSTGYCCWGGESMWGETWEIILLLKHILRQFAGKDEGRQWLKYIFEAICPKRWRGDNSEVMRGNPGPSE